MDLIPKFKMDYVYPAVIRYILFNTPEEQKTVTPEEKIKVPRKQPWNDDNTTNEQTKTNKQTK